MEWEKYKKIYLVCSVMFSLSLRIIVIIQKFPLSWYIFLELNVGTYWGPFQKGGSTKSESEKKLWVNFP